MSTGAGAALGAARAGIEFSWRLAWASYLLSLAAARGFPAGLAAAALTCSALLRVAAARRGWPPLPALLLRFAALAAIAFPAARLLWPSGLPPWYLATLAFACLWLLWDGGRAAVRDPQAHVPLDRGIAALLLLELVRLGVRVKGGRLPAEPAAVWLLAGLLLSGLAAIGLQRAGAEGQTRRMRLAMGLVLGLAVAVLLLLGMAAVRWYEPLSVAADSLLPVLGAVARPFGRALTDILLFLFSPKSLRGAVPDAGAEAGPGGQEGLAPAAGGLTLARILGLVLTALVALLGVAVLAVLAVQFVRWLLRLLGRPDRRAGRGFERLRLAALLGALLAALLRLPAQLCSGLAGWRRGFNRAAAVYGALLRWGSRSGLAAARNETPAEYGARVAARFPPLARDVGLIVEGFHEEVYGERLTAPEALLRLRAARRRLLGPRHWPARLRVLLQR